MRKVWWIAALIAAPAACGKGSTEIAAGGAGTTGFTIQLPMSLLAPGAIDRTNISWEPKRARGDTPSFTVGYVDMPLGPDDTGLARPFGDDAADRVIERASKPIVGFEEIVGLAEKVCTSMKAS